MDSVSCQNMSDISIGNSPIKMTDALEGCFSQVHQISLVDEKTQLYKLKTTASISCVMGSRSRVLCLEVINKTKADNSNFIVD